MKIAPTLRQLEAEALDFNNVADVSKVIELLRSQPIYEEFFASKLHDLRWIPVLKDAGFFNRLPSIVKHSDGSTSHPNSPLLSALIRLAPLDGVAVTDLYTKIELNDNIATGDQILRGIKAIQNTDLIPRLVPVVINVMSHPSQSSWVWLEGILETWLKVGATGAIRKVLRAVIDLVEGDSESRHTQEGWHVGEIDRAIIAPLSEEHPLEFAQWIFDSLKNWIDSKRRSHRKGAVTDPLIEVSGDESESEFSYDYWFENFELQSRSSLDIKAVLIQRLYSIGRFVFESCNDDDIDRFDSILRSDHWSLFQRLRWKLYADYPLQSLSMARLDTIERMPFLGSQNYSHNYEFALLLESHSVKHGSKFLSGDEVNSFVKYVLTGSVQNDDDAAKDGFRERFQRRQLQPIHSLIVGKNLEDFQRVSHGLRPLTTANYNPYGISGSSGAVRYVAPSRANEMDTMSDEELWDFLNNWQPKSRYTDSDDWLLEEDFGALGLKFAEYLETNPERFHPDSFWWKHLLRPELLHKPLERAAEKIAKKTDGESLNPPSDLEWRTWFGLAEWITNEAETSDSKNTATAGNTSNRKYDWNWSKIIVVRFLTTTLKSEYIPSNNAHPQIGVLLKKLVEDPDPRLTEHNQPSVKDWLTTAINSVRGTALEGLLDLGWIQMKANNDIGPDLWLGDVIVNSLRRQDQSPAFFAILGARAGLVLHLLGDRLELPVLLLPRNNRASRDAFIISHFLYHNAFPSILKTLTTLPDDSLSLLDELNKDDDDERRNCREFGGKLGVHLSYYYWNNAYQNTDLGDQILDRYFEIAKPGSRRTTIGQIGNLFEKAPVTDEHKNIYDLAMRLWDRRFERIHELIQSGRDKAENYYDELSEFTDWVACDCFPFRWRYESVIKAYQLLEKPPHAYALIKALNRILVSSDHLFHALNILYGAVKMGSSDIRWSFREKDLKPLLHRGLTSVDEKTSMLAEEIQDIFLRQGCFEFLDILQDTSSIDPQ